MKLYLEEDKESLSAAARGGFPAVFGDVYLLCSDQPLGDLPVDDPVIEVAVEAADPQQFEVFPADGPDGVRWFHLPAALLSLPAIEADPKEVSHRDRHLKQTPPEKENVQ